MFKRERDELDFGIRSITIPQYHIYIYIYINIFYFFKQIQ